MDSTELLIAAAFTGLYFLITLMLLSRVSHWAHATQEKLDKTNALLAEMLGRR